MKKLLAIMLCLCLLFSLTACAGQSSAQTESSQEVPSATDSESADSTQAVLSEQSSQSEPDTQPQENESNILIAYFTWAENTYVENPEGVDVDASSSASVLLPGNAAVMASWIQQEIGGDLFSIQVAEQYSSNYDECLDRAADEKAENARPALVSSVDNMEDYDTIFIGYPNWWYSCPMALFSFIEQNDLSDKKIVLFCTHGTGGLASSVRDITAALPEDCEIEQNVIGIYRDDVRNARPTVLSWLESIGY